MFNMQAPSLSDIAAVTGNKNNGDGFGGNNGWWVLIILFALFGGWGRGGYGDNGGSSSCDSRSNTIVYPVPSGSFNGFGGSSVASVSAEIQRGFDTNSIINKLDGISNGICSLGYDQLAQMGNISDRVTQTGFALQQAINNNGVSAMQNTNSILSTMNNCCCETREAIQQVRFDDERNTCNITNAIKDAVTAITQNDNANYRSLHDEQVAAKLELKDAKIAEQNQMIQMLTLGKSQEGQTNAIYSRMDAIVNSFDAKLNNLLNIISPRVPLRSNCCEPCNSCCN